MDRLEALVALNMIPGIGSVCLKRLLEIFTDPQDVFKARQKKLEDAIGLRPETVLALQSFDQKRLSKEFNSASARGVKIISIEDKDYPWNLKHIPGPPIVLYCLGRINQLDSLSIGIVGSRNASFYGLSSSEKFAADLSAEGFTIISGMARGIDSYAHRGALKSGGRTIAVIGSGFNHIYPPENNKLAEEISDHGAVLSEFPMDTLPLRPNFPRRNRLISGLSLGVLVVEAAKNSGALITADFALEQGREVFALPGKVDSETSFGTNQLIKQGAKLVSCVDDITEEFNMASLDLRKPKAKNQDLSIDGVNKEESFLYALISDEPVSFDEIAEKANLGIAQLARSILNLRMKKMILQLPGKQFIRYHEN